MIYDDGVEVNENMRVLECPCCGNTQFGDDDRFCIICGTSLYNTCEGADEYNDLGNYEGKGEQHNNLGNARYCALCGAKTEFFNKGILKPYTEVRGFFQTDKVKNFYSEEINDSGAETAVSDDDIPF